MAKRSGRGHDPGGITTTPSGGFAVACRACPHPGVNIPDDWESASRDRSWLYSVILSQDANFRLKNRLRSSHDADPALGPGYAYFVRGDEYANHLLDYVNQDEVCKP